MGSWSRPRDWWRASKTISGGILYDWGVHLLEYTFQIIDGEIAEVAGYAKSGFWATGTKWKKDTNEDEGFLVVRYRGGAWSTLCISHIDSNPKPGQVEVTGTKGSYVFDYRTYQLVTHKGSATVVTKGANPPSQHARFYQNIADHLCRGQPLVITPEWARRPVHVLDLAGRSAARGKALPAKYK
jgi:predicted dehydrogenase